MLRALLSGLLVLYNIFCYLEILASMVFDQKSPSFQHFPEDSWTVEWLSEDYRQKNKVVTIQTGLYNKLTIDPLLFRFCYILFIQFQREKFSFDLSNCIVIIIRFQVQFGINLHEWVFQKPEIARATLASVISSFLKTHKCKLISTWTRKTIWLLINNTNMKKFARSKCQKIFLEEIIFAFKKTFFRVSARNICHCFTWYQLTYKSSHCLSANHNPQLRCEIFTGVTLFVLVLHLNCTALSQSESSIFFMCIIKNVMLIKSYWELVINKKNKYSIKQCRNYKLHFLKQAVETMFWLPVDGTNHRTSINLTLLTWHKPWHSCLLTIALLAACW